MSAPEEETITFDRFLQVLLRCGLFDRDELKRIIKQVPRDRRKIPRKLAKSLVEANHLTRFQAANLLQGVWHGLVLGPYQILTPLGRGGMGTVYLAKVTKPLPYLEVIKSNLVALKILPPKKAKEKERLLHRFLREMEMAQRVDHPNITKTFDAGEINNVNYIAMEYIRGKSLKQIVEKNGPLSVPRTARLFAEVCEGLAHAHEEGLIHRDLKPSNIMITPSDHAKVLDLGLALDEDEREQAEREVVGGAGYVVGTMDYISPEQIDNSATVDHRADLYSMGCTMYYALSGRPPYPGGKKRQKLVRHLQEIAEPLAQLNPDVPQGFIQIVEKLMEKNPDRRYADALAARDQLMLWIVPELDGAREDSVNHSDADIVLEVERGERTSESEFGDAMPVLPQLPDSLNSGSHSSLIITDEDLLSEGSLDTEIEDSQSPVEIPKPKKKRPKPPRRAGLSSNEPFLPPILWFLMISAGLLILLIIGMAIFRR